MGKGLMRGFTLIELMIVIAIMAVIAALALPALLSAQMSGNERSATASLKTLATAEYDFRSNDRDGNLVNEFWTGDVAGLYSMTSGGVPGNADAVIKLIEVAVAGSDTAPLPAGSAGGENATLLGSTLSSPKAGYWIGVLDTDANDGENYQQDTGGLIAMGDVHHRTRFAFLAYPDASQKSGRIAAAINEGSTIYRRLVTVSIKPSTAVPPGAVTAAGWKDWPNDAALRADWVKLD